MVPHIRGVVRSNVERTVASGSKKEAFFICVVGLDGAGKTTQAHQLVHTLREQGTKIKYVWTKFHPWPLMPFVIIGRLLFLRHTDITEDYAEYSTARKRVFANRIIGGAYRYSVLATYFLQILFKIGVPLLCKTSIVCDRYVFDTMADLATDFGYAEEEIKGLLRGFLHFVPKPDLVFLIDLPEEVAYRRKNDVPSPGYLKERRGIYLSLAEEFGMIILDGCQDSGELHSQIQDRVNQGVIHG